MPVLSPAQVYRQALGAAGGVCARSQRQSSATWASWILGQCSSWAAGQVRPGGESQDFVLSLEKLTNRSVIQASCLPPQSQASLSSGPGPSQWSQCCLLGQVGRGDMGTNRKETKRECLRVGEGRKWGHREASGWRMALEGRRKGQGRKRRGGDGDGGRRPLRTNSGRPLSQRGQGTGRRKNVNGLG